MFELLLLSLLCAFAVGWHVGKRRQLKKRENYLNHFFRDYFVGLNFLLNEQPDKAVDIFVKMLTVDSETVETHLALGNLFRRRGEIDRAIRIHQNLIARPQLDVPQRVNALLALGQDYLRAGVLDRAERLFLSVLEIEPHHVESIHYLLDIYQQQRRWDQAVVIAKKFPPAEWGDMRLALAHYHCECAERYRKEKNFPSAEAAWKMAIEMDARCVRPYLGLAAYHREAGDLQTALSYYQQAIEADPEYLSDVIPFLVDCYVGLGDKEGLIHYLEQCLMQHPRAVVLLALIDQKLQNNPQGSLDFLITQLKRHPSLRGLSRLIQLQQKEMNAESLERLSVLNDITHALLKNKPSYRCVQCGLSGKVLHWQCPGCKSWGTSRPIHGVEGD